MKKQIVCIDLARFFLQTIEKDSIVSALFDFFEIDCFDRQGISPEELDDRISAFESTGCADEQMLSSVIELMRKAKRATGASEREQMMRIKKKLIDTACEELSLDDIAKELHISYYHLCHFFKSKSGVSPNTFRTQKKLEAAIAKLVKTDDKIADIATSCGFNSVSYFTEVFNKMTGDAPSGFREKHRGMEILPFYTFEDMLLAAKMPAMRFLKDSLYELPPSVAEIHSVHTPDESLSFLHEAAIIEYHGVLYGAWYHNPKIELHGYTPICMRTSHDRGKTWSELAVVADDRSGKILYCPPVFGVSDDVLYMLVNQMVGPDHIHSLDLYRLNEQSGKFEFCWSRPIPFKLNTNVVALSGGKLMLPGRVGRLDGFPTTPAVLISDSGKIDAEWRLVKIAENGALPDGEQLLFPELTVIEDKGELYMFLRNDNRRVPLVYRSSDLGESWSPMLRHDMPFISSKLYGGTLSDGRHYMIANVYDDNLHPLDWGTRTKLAVYFSEKDEMLFSRVVYFDNAAIGLGGDATHYPAAHEYDGVLYVIATINYNGKGRGAVLLKIDLDRI